VVPSSPAAQGTPAEQQ
jgi:hypothetical protein